MWEIGVDIVEVERFRTLNYSNHRGFFDRVFTSREIAYCLSFKNPAQHFAAIFAGKEAVYKAVNKHINIKLHQIEIIREGNAPKVNLAMEGEGKSGGTEVQLKVKVSLSHTSSYAVAFAVAMLEEPK